MDVFLQNKSVRLHFCCRVHDFEHVYNRMKRSHNKIRQWHKIRRFHAHDKCCQTDLTYPGILTDILLEILIKTPEKHDFWVIFLQYPLRYFSQIVENTCGIFCGCILGKKPCGPLFFKLYRTAPALDFVCKP